MVLPQIAANGRLSEKHGMSEHKQPLVPEPSRSPHRRPVKKHNASKKPVRATHHCDKCVHDLETSPDISLPSVAAGPIMLTSLVRKEDTFTNVIDSLNEANKVEEKTYGSNDWSDSTESSPRFPSVPTSHCTSRQSAETSLLAPTNSVTIISEVARAPHVVHMPLERLLDYGEKSRKVTIACSKYDEIGNPVARKAKHRRALSGKKWHRASSYANANLVQGHGRKENLNFMDSQLDNIYNSDEKTKKVESLSPKKSTMTPLPSLNRASDKTFRTLSKKSAERLVLNTMRAQKASKFECKIPTIPLSLYTKPRRHEIRQSIAE